MINDFRALLSKQNRFLFRKSLGKGVLITLLGSAIFVFVTAIVIQLRSSNHNIDTFFLFLLGFIGLFAFALTFLPVTFCIALLTLRLRSGKYQSQEARRRFLVEGAALGGVISLSIGLLVSFLNLLLIESIGKGSMIGVTLFTLEGILTGIITGSTAAFFLLKQSHS